MAAPSTSTNSPEVHAELNELLNGPAGKPPMDVVTNFHNPPNLDAVFIATTTLCASVAALAVLIRLYTKLVLIRSIAYEDCESEFFCSEICTFAEICQTLLSWLLLDSAPVVLIPLMFIDCDKIGEIGFIVTSSFILRSGGGLHMWDLQLKGFFRILYVRPSSQLKRSSSRLGITSTLVAQYLGHCLWHRRFPDQALHPPPISTNICPYPERKHGIIPRSPRRHMEYLHFLSCEYNLRDRNVPAT